MERTFVNAEIDGSTGKIVRQKGTTIRYFDEEQGYLFWPNKDSIKIFKNYSLPSDLTDSEIARVYRLSMVLQKGSNLISRRSGNAIKSMDTNKIANYLGISVRQATIFLAKMINRGIIGKITVKIGCSDECRYYINPIYFFCGKWLTYELYSLFKKDLDGIIPDWVKTKFNSDL